jgi:hypothetical protein
MAVTLRTLDGMSYSVEAAVDLRAAGLPQDAAVGFSAATGDLVESHQLLSWSFNSSTGIYCRKYFSIKSSKLRGFN